jgi:hypothetical protein
VLNVPLPSVSEPDHFAVALFSTISVCILSV